MKSRKPQELAKKGSAKQPKYYNDPFACGAADKEQGRYWKKATGLAPSHWKHPPKERPLVNKKKKKRKVQGSAECPQLWWPKIKKKEKDGLPIRRRFS